MTAMNERQGNETQGKTFAVEVTFADELLDRSDELQAVYERDTYLFFRGVLDRIEVERAADELLAAMLLGEEVPARFNASTPNVASTHMLKRTPSKSAALLENGIIFCGGWCRH